MCFILKQCCLYRYKNYNLHFIRFIEANMRYLVMSFLVLFGKKNHKKDVIIAKIHYFCAENVHISP